MPGSDCIDAGGGLHAAVLPDHDLSCQYVPHSSGTWRTACSHAADLGAYEFRSGDVDGDGAVELDDFTVFEACLLGPAGGLAELDCACVDFDTSGDVDLVDFAAFQILFTAP